MKQYGQKIVTNVTFFDSERYFYFRNEFDELFGIEKGIAQNEYELIKMIYVEKTFYSNDATNQAIYEYIYESKKFPLPYQNYKFLIVTDKAYKPISKPVEEEILNILKDVLGEIVVLDIKGSKVIFFFDRYDTNFEDLFTTISSDFYMDFIVHEGVILQSNERFIQTYIEAYQKLFVKRMKSVTNVCDLVMMGLSTLDMKIVFFLKKVIIKGIFEEEGVVQIIQTLFQSNLNISQASKELYMHRNTLISKLDQIKKQTGIDLQNFKQASIIHLLIQLKEDTN